jgi:HlyD family secretion protein
MARANQEEANVNLGYTTIRSPVKGVIVDRRVNIGQTVVASLNAPSLFLIARDLSRMQIWASVNESDVGSIRPGQKVRFTVSAFPNETFRGIVHQTRLNASMSQGVVTYTVVVEVDNRGGRLLPYLTARLQFEVEERKDVLLVPNAALRWMPSVSQVAPVYRTDFSQALRQRAAAGAERTKPSGDRSQPVKGMVWVKDDLFVRPVSLTVGLTDGLITEVTGGDIAEGTEVVLGLAQVSDDAGASPFLPKIKNDKASK